MHPYLPFAALPIAVTAAWFAASHWAGSEPGRYRVPPVAQIEEPSVPPGMSAQPAGRPDIRVEAFLPYVPPRPPAPAPTLVLHSVMTGTDMHLATINGRVVKEGDRIAGYLVKRITSDGVQLAAGDKTRRLQMRPLHELPPPVQPAADTLPRNVAARRDENDLNRDFWATFGSPQPQL
jgi:hypothetical protein